MTALWAYDYILTIGDEVVGFTDDNDAERNLTALNRSVTRGKSRALLVREPSRFRKMSLTDHTPVFTLFLLVRTPAPGTISALIAV